ncbi:MAG: hypothetical protein OWS74_00290 [Firmicutes bacterium]|nr:hypothetical protein [Bacillota bacterium]
MSDPQRQHAQLLALWAHGNKIIRRRQDLKLGKMDVPLEVWKWGQTLSERGLFILPLAYAVLFAAETQWGVLVPWDQRRSTDPYVFQRMIYWDNSDLPALRVEDGVLVLSHALGRRMGKTLWDVAEKWWTPWQNYAPALWRIEEVPLALDWLAAWRDEPQRMHQAAWQDSVILARLWRHRGHFISVPEWADASPYAWIAAHPKRQRYGWMGFQEKGQG